MFFSSSGFILSPLPSGSSNVYFGPTKNTTNSSCQCSTVFYSLLSACAYCQNDTYLECSDFTCLPLNAHFTFFLLLDGQSTMLIVPASTTKCELQFLYPYYVFLMPFSFPNPIPPSIVVPHYAYLDVVVRYVPHLPVECSLNIIYQ